jgi:hypothetical protein
MLTYADVKIERKKKLAWRHEPGGLEDVGDEDGLLRGP